MGLSRMSAKITTLLSREMGSLSLSLSSQNLKSKKSCDNKNVFTKIKNSAKCHPRKKNIFFVAFSISCSRKFHICPSLILEGVLE